MSGRYILCAGTALALGLGAATAQTTTDMDTDGDGSITVEEVLGYGGPDAPEGEGAFGDVYDFDIVGGVTAEEYLDHERGRLDANGDGTVDETEYAAWMEQREDASNEDAPEDAFGRSVEQSFGDLDADGDGALSREEFLRGEFGRFDTDGDGVLAGDEAAGLEEFISGSGTTADE